MTEIGSFHVVVAKFFTNKNFQRKIEGMVFQDPSELFLGKSDGLKLREEQFDVKIEKHPKSYDSREDVTEKKNMNAPGSKGEDWNNLSTVILIYG